MQKTYYVTTPIYYPSGNLTIGNSYTTVLADTLARYKKLRGYDVKFLTGTDEHGQKIERSAQKAGKDPKQFVDEIVDGIKKLWDLMDIEYDVYLRTTDEFHKNAIRTIFKRLYDQGDIYKSEYEGLYCTPCEAFFTEHQLVNGNCPDCGRPVETIKEESYFFRLSKYQDRLMKHLEDNPEFIMPASSRNEMINNFLKPGLDDLCVTRSSFTWGIPVDFDPDHVIYVWIDALPNYITGLGFASEDDSEYRKYWPVDVHLVGKEIVRFHTIIWPAILFALGEPLPKQVYANGWLLGIDNDKISKSKGNIVDPLVLIPKYGVDAVRYFLMREVTFGQDGHYSERALAMRSNADLANDLGNLVSRTVGMIDKYFGGTIPVEQTPSVFDPEIKQAALDAIDKVDQSMDKLAFQDALSGIWAFIRRVNKYTDENAPWVLIKDETKQAELANVLYVLAESLRIVSILISPFMPNTPAAIRKQLNMTDESILTWDSALTFGLLPKEVSITKGEIIFPRLDLPVEEAIEPVEKKPEKKKPEKKKEEPVSEIGIEDFGKVELKVGVVLECEKVDGSDKLLKSQIKIGEEVRQIVSGIATFYTPEQMVGKKVVVVTNLKPVKLRGVMSYGMILAASDESGQLNLVTIDGALEDGSVVR